MCRRHVESLLHATKSYSVNRPLHMNMVQYRSKVTSLVSREISYREMRVSSRENH